VLWGAVSRAVRRPTRLEEDLVVSLPNGAPLVEGDDRFIAESLVATELGYRVQPWPQLSIDATVFHHDYTDLRSQDLPPGGGLPLIIGNSLEGTSRGVELAINVQPIASWRTHVSYTKLDVDITRAPGSRDAAGGTSEGNDPDHLFSIRTSIDLPSRLEADLQLRNVGALPQPAVPAYTELNARLGWRARPRVELFLTGQDLLHAEHPEFTGGGLIEQFHRSVRLGTTLRF
jgi:iron complex outermembrane receptor protein